MRLSLILLLPVLLPMVMGAGETDPMFTAKEGGDGNLVIADAAFIFSIPYTMANKTKTTNTALKVPTENVTVTASLEKGVHTLDIQWGKDTDKTTLSLQMTENGTKTMLSKVDLSTVESPEFGFVDGDSSALSLSFPVIDQHSDFVWETKKGFSCSSSTELKEEEGKGATLSLSALKLQISKEKTFGSDLVQCTADKGKTTAAPKTTTPAPATTTTLAPENTYNVSSSDGKNCILLKAGILMHVTYNAHNASTSNTTFPVKTTVEVPMGSEVTVTGSCNETHNNVTGEQRLSLNFNETWDIDFFISSDKLYTGAANGNSYTVYKVKISGSLNSAHGIPLKHSFNLTNAVSAKGNGALTHFLLGSANKSVKCGSYSHEFGDLAKDNVTVDLQLLDVQFEAFASANGTAFSASAECESPAGSSDLIPIIVGACLAALVVIVLVAYLIGRARARRGGYQSV